LLNNHFSALECNGTGLLHLALTTSGRLLNYTIYIQPCDSVWLSSLQDVFEEINWRWCRHNTLPLSHIRSTVNDGVSPSPKGGRSRLGPFQTLPLVHIGCELGVFSKQIFYMFLNMAT